MPRRTNNGIELTPQDEKLMQLQQIQGPQDNSGGEMGGLVKMLSELYGIKQQQEKGPAELALLKSHANYYDQLGNERPEESQARGVALRAEALHNMYTAGLPEDAVQEQARQFGLLPPAQPKVQPQGEFNTPGATPPPSNSPASLLGRSMRANATGMLETPGLPYGPLWNNLQEFSPTTANRIKSSLPSWLMQKQQPTVGATQ